MLHSHYSPALCLLRPSLLCLISSPPISPLSLPLVFPSSSPLPSSLSSVSDECLLCFTLSRGQVAEQLAHRVRASATGTAEGTFDALGPGGAARCDLFAWPPIGWEKSVKGSYTARHVLTAASQVGTCVKRDTTRAGVVKKKKVPACFEEVPFCTIPTSPRRSSHLLTFVHHFQKLDSSSFWLARSRSPPKSTRKATAPLQRRARAVIMAPTLSSPTTCHCDSQPIDLLHVERQTDTFGLILSCCSQRDALRGAQSRRGAR